MRTVTRTLPFLLLTIAVFSAFSPLVQADTRTDVGATVVDGKIRSFYLAVGEYFRVPEREIIVIRERRIPDYEIPVVLFIAKRARVSPGVVIAYRSRGYSWTDVTLHFGLSPEIFYVPVREVYGPPYGRAYGYYKHKPRKEWRRIVLDDREVVDLVNLRVISEHYGYAPEEIMRRRAAGLDFVIINDELHSKKERKELEKERRKEDKALEREWKDEGKGHPPGRGDERERR